MARKSSPQLAHVQDLMRNVEALVREAQRSRHLISEVTDLFQSLGHQQPPTRALPPLPQRVQQVLDRLLVGDSEKEAAAKLGLSPNTIHMHVRSLYRRLGVSTRSELLLRCLAPPQNAPESQ